MNRLLAALLVASLAVNGWLGWKWAATRATVDPERPHHISPSAAAVTAAPLTRGGDFDPTPELPQRLRDAGMPPAMVRAVLLAALREKYRAELAATASPRPDPVAWWKAPTPPTPVEESKRQQREELNHRIAAELAALLGEPPPRRWDDVRYHFLSEEKERAVREIERDYQALLARTETFPHGDPAKAAYVREEMERDIAQALTPAEYAEFQLRFGSVAQDVRQRLGYANGTEEEFRTLRVIEDGLRAQLVNGFRFSNDAKGDALRRDYFARVESFLGPERALEYLWGGEPEYQMLKRAGAAHQQPQLASDVVRLRTEIGERARDIGHQADWSPAQKTAALLQLAQEARERLNTIVPTAVSAELPDKIFGWVDSLQSGQVRLYTPVTRGFGTFPIVPAPATSSAPPPRG